MTRPARGGVLVTVAHDGGSERTASSSIRPGQRPDVLLHSLCWQGLRGGYPPPVGADIEPASGAATITRII